MSEDANIKATIEFVGEMLAAGFTNAEVVQTLQSEDGLDEDEAVAMLKKVYEGWQDLESSLDLNDQNIIDWHVFLRKKVLRRALEENTTPSLRLALQVLDSLAGVQGVRGTEPQTVPLQISMVEKEKEKE